jgi:hypothetical protein
MGSSQRLSVVISQPGVVPAVKLGILEIGIDWS